MASRAARSQDFPELLAALCGLSRPTDEVTMANLYAGTTGKDLPAALSAKAGKTGLDIPAAFAKIQGVPVGDTNTTIKKITG